MRVGIDIRKYNDFGIGTYIQNLIMVFQSQPGLDCVYFAQDELIDSLKGHIKGKFVSDNSKKYSIRELFSVSGRANVQSLNLFHAPHYTLPVKLKAPSIVTIHDIIHVRLKEYFSFIKRSYAYAMIKHASTASSAIIVDSEFSKEELVKIFKVDEDKVHVIPLGVNQSYFDTVSAHEKEIFLKKYDISQPYILYTGSLKPHKNIPLLLKAFAKLIKSGDVQLVFSGEKLQNNPQLCNFVRESGLINSIRDLGRVEQAELRVAYQSAATVVLPSLYEGFGFSMLEAMASGVPAIGARTTSITEVVGNAGLLFDPFDENDLTRQIESVLSDQKIRSELIVQGTIRAKQFEWKRCAERTFQVYQKVVL